MLTLGFSEGWEDGRIEIEGWLEIDGFSEGIEVGQIETLGCSEGAELG